MTSKPVRHAPPLAVPSAWPDTMGLEQAAEYLRLGRDATRELWECGELPGVSLNQKHLVFRRVALDAFLARAEAKHQAEAGARAKAIATPQPRRSRRKPLPDLSRYEVES